MWRRGRGWRHTTERRMSRPAREPMDLTLAVRGFACAVPERADVNQSLWARLLKGKIDG